MPASWQGRRPHRCQGVGEAGRVKTYDPCSMSMGRLVGGLDGGSRADVLRRAACTGREFGHCVWLRLCGLVVFVEEACTTLLPNSVMRRGAGPGGGGGWGRRVG